MTDNEYKILNNKLDAIIVLGCMIASNGDGKKGATLSKAIRDLTKDPLCNPYTWGSILDGSGRA